MDSKAFFKMTYGLYVVGVKNGDKLGGCIVDAVMQTTTTPPTLVMCCHKGSWTEENIKETKEFTLSVLAEDTDPFIIGNFGFQSGRNVDKWEKLPYQILNGLPALEKAAAFLHCKITEWKDLSTHTLLFCDIAEAVNGESKALSYTAYQESWKPRVMEAFKASKSG